MAVNIFSRNGMAFFFPFTLCRTQRAFEESTSRFSDSPKGGWRNVVLTPATQGFPGSWLDRAFFV
jgi:hypothetical protein